MSTVVLGIDPGLKGGLAVLTRGGDVVDVRPMPVIGGEIDVSELHWCIRAYVASHRVSSAAMEKVSARPNQGVCSTFKFGTGYGMVQGVLASNAVGLHLVRPQAWQKQIIGGHSAPDPKAAALLWCRRRFPGLDLKAPRGRKPHDGIVDALAIAEFARQLSFGKQVNGEIQR